MLIKTTGLDEYAPGGQARVKVLVIGGPGTGKTRWASYFPKPFYANCEGGLAAVADRKVPYVDVNTSQDMLDVLAFMKQECQQPLANRKYDTLVVDTLDAFQRKVKDEWLVKEKKQVFTGWEAWGFMNSKMQMLMTRLLNLDMNIVVLVHYKDKTTKSDDVETHTIGLQVQGELADTAFNDFDLVAWMGTYWEAVEGERKQKRGLTFKATPEKPFLKDRLHVTPDWMEVVFEPSDYTGLFDAIQSRVADIAPGAIVGEILSSTDEPATPYVVTPGAIGTGPLPATTPRELPLNQMDRPTLIKMARDAGLAVKGNNLKSEIITALEAHRNAPITAVAATPPAPARQPETSESTVPAASEPVKARVTDTAAVPTDGVTWTVPSSASATRVEPEGVVDVRTGELLEAAVKTVGQVLGGEVIEDKVMPIAPEPVVEAVPAGPVCEICETDLALENSDFVKLGWIKYRKRLCQADYTAIKNKNR